MEILARKTRTRAFFLFDLVVGILLMAAAILVLPIGVFSIDLSLIKNGFVLIVVGSCMLIFGLIGFFCFLRPFLLFMKLPEVQAETDGTYLYIYGRKEARIPLAEMDGAYVEAIQPYILTWDFIVHLLSANHGTVIVKVPGYGKFKLYNVERAKDAAAKIISVAEKAVQGS